MSITLNSADWLQLFLHFFSLSLLAVGGAITTAPDMHRFLVVQSGWLNDRSSLPLSPWHKLRRAPTCCSWR